MSKYTTDGTLTTANSTAPDFYKCETVSDAGSEFAGSIITLNDPFVKPDPMLYCSEGNGHLFNRNLSDYELTCEYCAMHIEDYTEYARTIDVLYAREDYRDRDALEEAHLAKQRREERMETHRNVLKTLKDMETSEALGRSIDRVTRNMGRLVLGGALK